MLKNFTQKITIKMTKAKFFALGIILGTLFVLAFNGLLGNNLRSRLVWEGRTPPDTKIQEIYTLLERFSINAFDRSELLDSMYRGLLEGVGDPYTFYFDRDALALFLERTEGVYAGIGTIVALDPDDKNAIVVEVFENSPAAAAGLRPGDKILEIDGVTLIGRSIEQITRFVKGAPGTQVSLNVQREGGNFPLTITRQRINVPTVSHRMLESGIGYIRITGFEGVTLEQFTESYTNLHSAGLQGLIIDLRNNPGGRLDVVAQISDLLLPEGVILTVNYKSGQQVVYRSDARSADIPLVVLVNGQSASASEVMTGAIRDHGAGTVVGERTFGKGVVQSLFKVSDESAIKITVARYYTPAGYSIHGEGIEPDHVVEVDRDTAIRAASLELEEDVQLQRAIEVMQGKV